MRKLLASVLVIASLGLFAVPASASGITTVPSNNWTGYAITGSITGATATFTVPYLTNAVNCKRQVAIWVGVGGLTTKAGLLQGGVVLTPINPVTGVCSKTSFWVRAFWEKLPAPMQLVNPLTLSIRSGDSVSVAVGYLPANNHRWAVDIVDNTNGEGFVSWSIHASTAPSADYVVEAITNKVNCDGVCPLAPFVNGADSQPGVTFTNCKFGGTMVGADKFVLDNTTTSAVNANNSFTVSYDS